MTDFKAGDIVWCIDSENNGGCYTITHYHRQCVVTAVGKNNIRVRCLFKESDEDDCDLKYEWPVEKKLFALVKQRAVII